jgi:hypothetical protein
MHLAIFADDFSRGTDQHGGVVIQARPRHLEDRRDDVEPVLAGLLLHAGLGVSIIGFGVVHVPVVSVLGKILGVEEFRQDDDVGMLAGGFVHEGASALHVFIPRCRSAIHLDQGESHANTPLP